MDISEKEDKRDQLNISKYNIAIFETAEFNTVTFARETIVINTGLEEVTSFFLYLDYVGFFFTIQRHFSLNDINFG